MFVPYNDYVLSASLQAGWITAEQEQAVQHALQHLPEGTSVLDFLAEQQMLTPAQVQQLKDLILQSMQEHSPQASHAEVDHSHEKASTHSVAMSETAGHVHDYLKRAGDAGASDVHLGPDFPPLMRIFGGLQPFPDHAMLTPDQTETLARGFLTAEQIKRVEEIGSVEFCYEVPGLGRYRTSVVRQRRGWESIFRIIAARVRSMKELGLPEVLHTLTQYHNGLILVTGSVGSGKSTTLAAMVEQINQERHDHIITLEDPIEYVFNPANCQVSQREVRSHTASFSSALRASLREDPDVIMVGEMRDLETISLAITASETGHLVLGTLHTSTAARTLDRLLDVFPIEQQAQIRTMVSESIRGIVCQQLIPRADGNGRVMALEVMINTPAVGNLIRESKTFMLPGVIQTGKKLGMRLMDDSIIELLDQGLINIDEALARIENKRLISRGK